MSRSITDTLSGLRAAQADPPQYSVKLTLPEWVQVVLALMSAQSHAQMLVSKVMGSGIADNVPLRTVVELESIEAEIHAQVRGQSSIKP